MLIEEHFNREESFRAFTWSFFWIHTLTIVLLLLIQQYTQNMVDKKDLYMYTSISMVF